MSLLLDFELIFYDYNNERENFTSQLLRLIAKADPANMAKIERGFPEAVRLYKTWMNSEAPIRGRKAMTKEQMKLAFEKSHRGFTIKAYWGDGPEAKIQVTRNGSPYEEFPCPAYRILNLYAHFDEMVEKTITKDTEKKP